MGLFFLRFEFVFMYRLAGVRWQDIAGHRRECPLLGPKLLLPIGCVKLGEKKLCLPTFCG